MSNSSSLVPIVTDRTPALIAAGGARLRCADGEPCLDPTTQLYDRCAEVVTLDDVEPILV